VGAAALLLSLAPKPTPTPEPRRIALRPAEGFSLGPDFERIASRAKRRGIEVQALPESSPVPKGWEEVYLATFPAPESLRTLLAAFPIVLEAGGFQFDGRTYRSAEDAIVLADPSHPRTAFAIGNSQRTVARLAIARLFWREGKAPDYEVASGELSKEGSFLVQAGRLEIDRTSDRDRIATRDEFFRALRRETQGGVEWEFRDSERAALARWQKAASAFAPKRPFVVRLFPDAATKALYTGSSRPADLSADGGRIRVDIDVSTPEEPDLVSPVLAAAGLAVLEPAALDHPTLLLAQGARKFGKWWGRDVRGFAAFTRAAKVEPSIEEVVLSSEDVSPVLAVGTAAAWLDAGARLDGEKAVARALGQVGAKLVTELARWREAAARQPVAPPARRPLPSGFLRGVSYAMTNSIEEAYVAPRSLETLKRLRGLSVDSVSVMPFAFARDAKADRISFIHRNPQGETDEGTLRVVTDARSLGMSAMVKPQLWVGGDAFVGDVAMEDEKAWRSWFDSYRRFIVHQAVVAEASGAALFCVGTELASTEERKNDWHTVIAGVRLATGAPLLYAANWAANAPRVLFWDALDAIGVDFYDPLAKSEKASDAMLEQGARQAVRPLAELSLKLGKPVILAEAGYPPVRAAWIAPHDEASGRPAGGEDAARSVNAVYRALARESWWKGVYWWKVYSDGKPAPAGDRGFNILGTPAEKAIREGFAKPLGVSP
jgi:hypothetical protein